MGRWVSRTTRYMGTRARYAGLFDKQTRAIAGWNRPARGTGVGAGERRRHYKNAWPRPDFLAKILPKLFAKNIFANKHFAKNYFLTTKFLTRSRVVDKMSVEGR